MAATEGFEGRRRGAVRRLSGGTHPTGRRPKRAAAENAISQDPQAATWAENAIEQDPEAARTQVDAIKHNPEAAARPEDRIEQDPQAAAWVEPAREQDPQVAAPSRRRAGSPGRRARTRP